MMHKVPSLVDLCIQVAVDYVRYLGDVGETDFHLLERILPHCTLDQLMHIENNIQGPDLNSATDELWKMFYMRQFGIESTNLVVDKMRQKRVVFKWKQLYEAKLKHREEATQKSLDRIKKRYQEEDAIFWNPLDKKSKTIPDLGDEDYKHMLCVESAAVENLLH